MKTKLLFLAVIACCCMLSFAQDDAKDELLSLQKTFCINIRLLKDNLMRAYEIKANAVLDPTSRDGVLKERDKIAKAFVAIEKLEKDLFPKAYLFCIWSGALWSPSFSDAMIHLQEFSRFFRFAGRFFRTCG